MFVRPSDFGHRRINRRELEEVVSISPRLTFRSEFTGRVYRANCPHAVQIARLEFENRVEFENRANERNAFRIFLLRRARIGRSR